MLHFYRLKVLTDMAKSQLERTGERLSRCIPNAASPHPIGNPDEVPPVLANLLFQLPSVDSRRKAPTLAKSFSHQVKARGQRNMDTEEHVRFGNIAYRLNSFFAALLKVAGKSIPSDELPCRSILNRPSSQRHQAGNGGFQFDIDRSRVTLMFFARPSSANSRITQ